MPRAQIIIDCIHCITSATRLKHERTAFDIGSSSASTLASWPCQGSFWRRCLMSLCGPGSREKPQRTCWIRSKPQGISKLLGRYCRYQPTQRTGARKTFGQWIPRQVERQEWNSVDALLHCIRRAIDRGIPSLLELLEFLSDCLWLHPACRSTANYEERRRFIPPGQDRFSHCKSLWL
jgi:hypothetical protein